MIVGVGQQDFLAGIQSGCHLCPLVGDRPEGHLDRFDLRSLLAEDIAVAALGIDGLDRHGHICVDMFDKNLDVRGRAGFQHDVAGFKRDLRFVLLEVRVEPSVFAVGDGRDHGDRAVELLVVDTFYFDTCPLPHP